MLAATTGIPVSVLLVVALAGAFANIVGSAANAVQAWIGVRRLESQMHEQHELAKRIGRHVGMSDDELDASGRSSAQP